jgi:hypothetical protein
MLFLSIDLSKTLSSLPMRVLMIIGFFFSVMCLQGQTRLDFEKVTAMPNEAYAFGYTESSRDIFALGGGEDFQGFSSFLHIYDAAVDFWLTVGLEQIPLIQHPSTAYMEKYNGLLLLGGIQGYGASIATVDEIRMINLDDYSVSNLGVLPEPAKGIGLAYEGGKAYFFGGSRSMTRNMFGTSYYKCSNQLFVYDMDRGHLEKLPDMPLAMETDGGIVDGNLYVFGGFDGTSLSGVYQYNIDSKEWKTLPPLKEPVSSYALAQYEHYFFLVGDFNATNQLIVYDTEKQSARYFKTNFSGRHLGASVVGDQLHVYGGLDNTRGSYIKQEHYRIAISELIQALEQ